MRTFSVTNRMGAIAVIAAAAIALAACGGGGGLNEDEAAGLRGEVEAAEAAAAAAEAARAAALAAQEAAEAQSALDKAAKETAEAAQEAAEAERDREVAAAREAQTAAEAAQAQAEAAQAQAEARSAEEVAAANLRADEAAKAAEQARTAKEAADTAAEMAREARDAALAAQREAERAKDRAEAELATARQQLTAAQRAAENARQEAERARLAAEQEAQRQIEQAREEAEQQADANMRAKELIDALEGITQTTTESTMSVAHMPGAARPTFRRPNALPATGSAPRVPGSWRSASYIGPRGSVGTDTVYLYTNIQPPDSKAFWKVHGESVASTATDFETTAKPSGFGTTAKKLYPDHPTDGAVTKDNASVSGTYDGYSGRFTCETGCNIEAVSGGALTFTGSWTFTASLTAKKRGANTAEQDSEFLYFGIWAYEPTDPGADPEFKWAAAGAGSITADPNFGALEGEATFTGGAIGKYALARATGRGARAAKTGTFTATATFTAVFGGSPTISGRITDFKEGGSDLGSDWSVFLGASASAAATLAATGAGGTLQAHGEIDGDQIVGADDTWAATLFGSDNADMSEADGYTSAKYPRADVAGVAGWFRAAAGPDGARTAALAGAFGAACTTGAMCAR